MSDPRDPTPDTDDPLATLWRSQETRPMDVPFDLIERQATTFQRTIRVRNGLEYAAGALAAGLFARTALDDATPVLLRAAALLTLAGVVVVVTNLWLRGHAAAEQPGPGTPTAVVLAWHRAQLVRQLELLRRVPVWYLGPLVPGLALHLVASAVASAEHPGGVVAVVISAAVIAGVLGAVAWVNRRAARKLEETIAALPLDGRGVGEPPP